jgi:hypothetical protein
MYETAEKVLEAMFYMQSIPRLHNKNLHDCEAEKYRSWVPQSPKPRMTVVVRVSNNFQPGHQCMESSQDSVRVVRHKNMALIPWALEPRTTVIHRFGVGSGELLPALTSSHSRIQIPWDSVVHTSLPAYLLNCC